MRYFFILVTIASFVIACSSSGTEEKKDSAKVCKNDVNPNGSSELAQLMRSMAAWTDTVKHHVHQTTPPLPINFSRIHLLTKTDSTIDKKLFDQFADIYTQKVNDFIATDPKLDIREKKYNEMVSTCVSCHENFCHGPIKRIKKLFLITL